MSATQLVSPRPLNDGVRQSSARFWSVAVRGHFGLTGMRGARGEDFKASFRSAAAPGRGVDLTIRRWPAGLAYSRTGPALASISRFALFELED